MKQVIERVISRGWVVTRRSVLTLSPLQNKHIMQKRNKGSGKNKDNNNQSTGGVIN
jgi:hypothetical protein